MPDSLFGETPRLTDAHVQDTNEAHASLASALVAILVERHLITKDQLIDELKSKVTDETTDEVQSTIRKIISRIVELPSGGT